MDRGLQSAPTYQAPLKNFSVFRAFHASKKFFLYPPRMNEFESALLKELTGGAEPKLLLRTRTRIDCGRWWRKTPVWLCITANELILFAVARRRYTERAQLSDCHASHYAHATGQLVIDPAETLRNKHLSLTPREALDVLDFLLKK